MPSGKTFRGVLSHLKRYSESSLVGFGSRVDPKKLALAALVVFVVALSVRLLYFDDRSNRPALWDPLIPTGGVYVSEAERMVKFGFFARDLNPRGHARHLLHPPGYLLYLIGLFKLVGWDDRLAIMAIQAVLDSITTVLILIFASYMTNLRVGVLAGLLIAISPHLAYGALFVSPESPFVLPVVLAVGSLYFAYRKNRLRYYLLAGLLLGLACWLRSNALAMSPFFALMMIVLATDRKAALKGALAMVLVTAAVIAPITYRNFIITGRFIPLTVGFGVIFMQAVADYDFDKEYGLPKLDPEVAVKEAEWYNRPDYAGHFLRPDGIDRDSARIWRTLDVIKKHPLYYLSTIFRRIDFILRYDLPPGPDDWPFHTATPVFVAKNALYGHGPPEGLTGPIVWSSDSGQSPLSSANQNSLVYRVGVEEQTDYVIALASAAGSGSVTWRVTNENGEIELGSATLELTTGNSTALLPFASRDNRTVKIEFNCSPSPLQGTASSQLHKASLTLIGTTPSAWTDPARGVVRGLQRNLYQTLRMRILMLIGVAGMILAGRRRALIWIAAVPLYFLMFQSLLHTEYRYILSVHYYLFILVAVGLFMIWRIAESAVNGVSMRLSGHKSRDTHSQ